MKQRALVLGGGGLLGAMFQVGVLASLEKLDRRRADFDLVVGTSGGAVVAALLAAGLTPAELLRMAPSFAPGDLHALTTEGLDAAPSGTRSLDPLIEFLAGTLQQRGCRDRFDALPRRLLVPAIDLDWGERVVFGAGSLRSASVSRAVAASCAIPRLFAPVKVGDRDLIDGGIADLLNLDLALGPEISEVLAIHAVVAPINDGRRRCLPSPSGECGGIAEQGSEAVMRQASKIGHMLVTNTLIDLRGRARRTVTIEVLQPDRFAIDLHGLMDFRRASRLLDEGRRTAERYLASRSQAEIA